MRFRVLLVDGEDEFVRTFSERFQFKWLSPGRGFPEEDALRTVRSEVPGVMVMDLRSPGMDGTEVLRQAQREHPRAQVIILSDHFPLESVADHGASPRSRHFDEPLDIDELLETLDRAYTDRMMDLVVAPTFSKAGRLRSAFFITERD